MDNQDTPEGPLEPVDPETERLLAWFIKNRRRVAWTLGCEKIIIGPADMLDDVKTDDMDTFVVYRFK